MNGLYKKLKADSWDALSTEAKKEILIQLEAIFAKKNNRGSIS